MSDRETGLTEGDARTVEQRSKGERIGGVIVTGFSTLQLHTGGLFDGESVDHQIHLVRSYKGGTPGSSLCGLDRFDLHCGFSVGGGYSHVTEPCPVCVEVARRMRITADLLPIRGTNADRVEDAIREKAGVAHG